MAERMNWAQQIINDGALNNPVTSTSSPAFRDGNALDYTGEAREAFLDSADELTQSSPAMPIGEVIKLSTVEADETVRRENTHNFQNQMNEAASGKPYVTPDARRAYRKTQRLYAKRQADLDSAHDAQMELTKGDEVSDQEERYWVRKERLSFEEAAQLEMNNEGYVFNGNGDTIAYPIWKKPLSKEEMHGQIDNLENLLMNEMASGARINTDSDVILQIQRDKMEMGFKTLASKLLYGELALEKHTLPDGVHTNIQIKFDPAYKLADLLLTSESSLYGSPQKIIAVRRMLEKSPDIMSFTHIWEQLFPSDALPSSLQNAFAFEERKNLGRQLERRLLQLYRHEMNTRKPYLRRDMNAYSEAHSQREHLETQVDEIVTGAGSPTST